MGLELEKKRQENLDAIRDFTLMDDTFMTQVFSGNIEATEYILSVILQREDLKVEQVITQFPLSNLYGRSVRLDIYARDVAGKQYDIEIQQKDAGAVPERARLNSSLFDAQLTNVGQKDYKNIPETYVIFITGNDVLKAGLPIYNIERVVLQTQEQFGDKAHIVYVNGTYRGEDAVGELMRDFHCSDYRDMKNKILASMVQYYKEDPEGVSKMCEAMDRISERRAMEARIENALEMIADGQLPLEKIARYSGLSLEKVKELADKKSA
ncbi:MAG: PD-(D/E)XK nuclease family transposase [Lachnospiraceae bacterium]